MELGLDDDHPELHGLGQNWDRLKELCPVALSQYEAVREFMDCWSTEDSVKYIVEKSLSEDRLSRVAGTKLFTLIAKERQFSQRWGLSGPTTQLLAKAFCLEILGEYIPISIIREVCARVGISPSLDMPLARCKAESADSSKNNLSTNTIVPRKRGPGGKAQAKLEEEAKSSKRITSFFKPKSQ